MRQVSYREAEETRKKLEAKGVSPKLADMLAHRKAPALKGTDTQFWKEHGDNHGIEGGALHRRHVIQKAKAAGISIAGRKFIGQLADGRGAADPQAWVMDTTDIKRICEERGYGCEGAVTVAASHVERPEVGSRLGWDLVDSDVMNKRVAGDQRPWMEIASEVIDKCGRPGREGDMPYVDPDRRGGLNENQWRKRVEQERLKGKPGRVQATVGGLGSGKSGRGKESVMGGMTKPAPKGGTKGGSKGGKGGKGC
jgi:hypothetical protein